MHISIFHKHGPALQALLILVSPEGSCERAISFHSWREMMHLAVHPTAAERNVSVHTSTEHPCFPGWTGLGKEAGLRTDNLLTVVGLPGQEPGAAWGSDGKVSPHHMGLGPVALALHHCWAKQTHQGSRPFGVVEILTAQGVSQNSPARCSCYRAGRDGSRVRAPLPCEAANLNWVHECQQVSWREEGRGDIGASGGSIYSCFLKNPV